MTFRAKPVVKRSGRFDRDGGDRRTLLVNLGFTAAIVLSLLILVGYAAWAWWDDHNGTAATVNGVSLTKDDGRARYAIEKFRLDYTEARIRTLEQLGRISGSVAAQQLSFLEQRRQSLALIALGRMVDIELQRQLAEGEGITVTDAEVDAQFLKERTFTAERHGWLIELAPEDDPETGEPGDVQKEAAREKAEKALADLRAGKPWDEIAKQVSISVTAPQAGDLGWLDAEAGLDEAFVEALFGVTLNTPTAVVEGEDGVFRIGRVTEEAPEEIDTTYEARLAEAEIELADYLLAVRADVVRQKLDDMVVAELSAPGPQRHVLQIFLPEGTPTPDGVKVRHILFAPKDDPGGAATLPDTDPAWKVAEDEAKAAYETLREDISKFDEMARELSDEGSATQTGGKLPFYSPTSPIDNEFAAAIFAGGLEPDELLAPVKTSFGWHVIQFLRPYGDGDVAWLAEVRADAEAGTDFADLARIQGDGEEASEGGDIGWIAEGTLGDLKEAPIFTTSIGGLSAVTAVPGDGTYLWKVLEEEVREPTEEQIAAFKATGFDEWYAERYAEADIETDSTAASVFAP